MPGTEADAATPTVPRGPALAVGVAVVLATLGTGAALDILPGPTEAISVWMSETEAPDFTLDSFDADPVGRNRIDVSFEVRNTDDETHRANVTVQLLDEDGDVLTDGDGEPLSETVDTGDVVGTEGESDQDGTHKDTVRFEAEGVVEAYQSTLITIDQRY